MADEATTRLWFLEGALQALQSDIEGDLPKEQLAHRVERIRHLVHTWGHPNEPESVPDVPAPPTPG